MVPARPCGCAAAGCTRLKTPTPHDADGEFDCFLSVCDARRLTGSVPMTFGMPTNSLGTLCAPAPVTQPPPAAHASSSTQTQQRRFDTDANSLPNSLPRSNLYNNSLTSFDPGWPCSFAVGLQCGLNSFAGSCVKQCLTPTFGACGVTACAAPCAPDPSTIGRHHMK